MSEAFASWFGTTGHVSVVQECARAVVVFTYGVIAMRLAGRRIFAAWAAPDIIVAIIFGSSLSRTLTGNAPMAGTLAATTVLLLLHAALSRIAAYVPAVSRLVEGMPVDLTVGGKLSEGIRRRFGLSPMVIREALHQAGIDEIEKARRLVLEPSGKISIVRDSIPPEQHHGAIGETPHV